MHKPSGGDEWSDLGRCELSKLAHGVQQKGPVRHTFSLPADLILVMWRATSFWWPVSQFADRFTVRAVVLHAAAARWTVWVMHRGQAQPARENGNACRSGR